MLAWVRDDRQHLASANRRARDKVQRAHHARNRGKNLGFDQRLLGAVQGQFRPLDRKLLRLDLDCEHFQVYRFAVCRTLRVGQGILGSFHCAFTDDTLRQQIALTGQVFSRQRGATLRASSPVPRDLLL